ncbi:MAG: hypothetical protein MUP22_12325 [Desulfobacterales bacterium]|nr:hypothetical protein [Desulfobacterales bacterium]
MQKNQIYIPLAKISFTVAIFSACALMLSWTGRFLLGSHEKVIGIFILAFVLSVTAVITGILALVRPREARERRFAWFGTIAGFILLVPTGAVGVIFLVILF